MSVKRFRKKKYPTYNLGDTGPGGGVIFLTPNSSGNNTKKYFEAKKGQFYDLDYSLLIPFSSYSSSSLPTGIGTESYIGSGESNTKKIYSSINTTSNTILSYMNNLNSNSRYKWFIPSKEEMNALLQYNPSNNSYLLEYWSVLNMGYLGLSFGMFFSSSIDESSHAINTFYTTFFDPWGWSSDGSITQGYVVPVRSFYPYGV